MASPELRRLWKLHQIDAALHEIRHRAAALDPGKKETATLQAEEARHAALEGEAKALHGEQLDLELKQRTAQDKAAKFEKELFGGKVVNPREVEAMQKEIATLKKQASSYDDRLLELMDLVPEAQAKVKALEPVIVKAKADLQARRKQALEEKTKLEEAFKANSAARPAAAKEIDAGLLAKYDAIRNKAGTGMAQIQKGNFCEGCHSHLAERTVQSARDDKLVTCEQCHRILYYTDGLI
jgi:uncharacterized protein